MDYRGLLCDFDGTIHVGQGIVSPAVTHAIKQLRVPFGICTGRQFEFIHSFLVKNHIGGVHVACGGAQLVAVSGEVIREETNPAETMRDIASLIESAKGYLVLKHNGAMYGNHLARRTTGRHANLPIRPLEDVEDWRTPAFYVSQINDATWATLLARPDINLIKQRNLTHDGQYFADGMAAGVNKATGVRWWCEYHQLDPQTVVGIGDGENDVDLFAAVGLRLAMGNAVPELRAVADAILPSINDDGVAWAIEHYFDS